MVVVTGQDLCRPHLLSVFKGGKEMVLMDMRDILRIQQIACGWIDDLQVYYF